MAGKPAIAISLGIGALFFVVLLKSIGYSSIAATFQRFSLPHIFLFMLISTLLYLMSTLRWAIVLKYQNIKFPFLTLLKFKLIGVAIGYITPAARLGGEPLRAYLLKRRLKNSKIAYSSVLMETSLGISLDALFFALALVSLIFFMAMPFKLAVFSILISLIIVSSVVLLYSTLVSRLGPFSFIIRLLYTIVKKPFLKNIVGKVRNIEDNMIDFLKFKKKGVLLAISVSLANWPLTFLQYKFALQGIGFDASFSIILLSIITLSVTGVLPIPASLGVQEAGQFSVFNLVAFPSIGFALSLLVRSKDILATFIGLFLLSHEGLGILEAIRKKK